MAACVVRCGVARWVRSAVRRALFVALLWPIAVSAQQDGQQMKACNLLTPAELSAAIGGNAGQPMGTFSPKNSQLHRDGDFWSCEETVGARNVWIFSNTLPLTAEGKKLAQEQNDRYRKQGYQIQERELSGSRCATTVPPGGAKNPVPPPGTSCERDKGPYHIIVSVQATGANDLVPMEKVASLVEKAASRLPSQSLESMGRRSAAVM